MATTAEVKTLGAALEASGVAFDPKRLAKDAAYFAQMHALASAPEPEAPKAEPLAVDVGPYVDYVCGLRKVGPRAYTVVVGKVVDGKPDFKVDTVAQPLEFAAEEVLGSFRKLMDTIP